MRIRRPGPKAATAATRTIEKALEMSSPVSGPNCGSLFTNVTCFLTGA